MRVNPTDGHYRFFDLHFEELDFICHGALILLTSLCWKYQRCNGKLAILFFTGKDSTSLDFARRVRMRAFKEFGDNFYRT